MRIARKIKQIRSKSGMTQQEFSDHIGVSQSSVAHWELGSKKPKIDAVLSIIKLAKKLGIKANLGDFFKVFH